MNKVEFPLRQQRRGAKVARLHEALRALGLPVPDPENSGERFGPSTRAAVLRWQTDHGLPATGFVDEATASAINTALEALGPTAPAIAPADAGRRVTGTIRHADGTALAGLVVQAFHRRVGGEMRLGPEAASDDQGAYAIAYDLPPGASAVDLFVRAFDTKRTVIAVSAILIDAPEQARLDLTARAPALRGPSDFARATEALGPRVTGTSLATLDANDVALLVRATGLAREQVTAWIAAKQLAARTDVAHESLYALVRGENTASLPRLLRRSSARLVRTLETAARANVISQAAGAQAEASVQRLKTLVVQLSSSSDTPGSLGALLATCTAASPAQQSAFVARYAAHDGPVRVLWSALRADPQFGDAVVDDMQLSLDLGTITANHPALVKALHATGVKRASQTAALDAAAWQQLVKSAVDGKPVGTPGNIKGRTAAERESRYVALLQERSARAFPTSRLTGALRSLPSWQSSAAVAFLDANPDFNLLEARLDEALGAKDIVIRPDWDRARLERELGMVQRVARVSPRGKEAEVANALLDAGYDSAFSIARQSRDTFRQRTGAGLGDAALADRLHRNAQFQVARTGHAYALMHPWIGGGVVRAVGAWSREVTENPTWASLFGNVDYCRCEHCRSVYGPAAYFVDLLQWLDGHGSRGRTAFDLLNQRRPDLQRLELSCANTNTALPYVDLVLEILETRVLNPGGNPAGPALVPQATTAETPELLANPEYLNAAAYDAPLARAVHPVILPFDLWGELGRVYLAHLGVARANLMEALARGGNPGADAIAGERLRLSPAEWDILIGAARHKLWSYWGYDIERPGGIDFRKDLATVSTFLSRAGIDYDELLDLLHTRFVGAPAARITGSDSDTDKMTLAGLTDDVLGNAHGFLRLWRKRGGSMLELDKTLYALRLKVLDPAGLVRLSNLDRVIALTGAAPLEALAWWSPLDTYPDRPETDVPEPSLYDRVYLNRAVDAGALEPDFPLALNGARNALANTGVTWDSVRALLQAALAIDADELAWLLDETVDGIANPQRVVTGSTATLEGLSALYRHVTFARRLRRTVPELLALLRLQQLRPFDIRDTSAAVAFIESADRQRRSAFSLQDLQYLLEHDLQAEVAVGITDEAIGQALVELRDGLTRVVTDFAVVADPQGEVTARYLAILLDAATLPEVIQALATEADEANRAALEQMLGDALHPFVSFDAAALMSLAVSQRYAATVALLAPYLQRTQCEAVIIEKTAAFSDRSLEATRDMLALRLRMTVGEQDLPALAGLRISPYTATTTSEIGVADDEEAFATMRRLFKATLLLARVDLDVDGQAWLFDVGIANGLLDPLALPVTPAPAAAAAWAGWERLVDLAALEKELPGGEPRLVDLLRMLESPDDSTVSVQSFLGALAARTGWLREDLDALVAAFAPPFPAGWRDGGMLRRLVAAFAMIGRLGVSATQADRWVTSAIDAGQAEALRLAAKSKHDEQSWPAIARALRDPVRERQREALVAYLVGRHPEYGDEAALFKDLLIDVEMAPCMLTSRLKQAISSVQLFVHRAFLNLEPGFEPSREDHERWEWMSNYRVWEAARKVFLYPENWIEPELRPDKSPLFERLENSLLRGDLDEAAAETAYTEYLEGLQKIARVEVMGLYHELSSEADGVIDRLHVVARTRSQPHEYLYRQWLDRREWTPWESLDADIEGNHLILALRDRRLFVFWPMVVEKAESSQDPDARPDESDEMETRHSFEMKLAWMERQNGQWGARRLSPESLVVDDARWADEELDVYFRLGTGDVLSVECLRRLNGATSVLGTFVIDACSGSLVVDPTAAERTDVVPAGEYVARMRMASLFGRNTEIGYLAQQVAVSAASHAVDGAAVTAPEDIVLLTAKDEGRSRLSYAYPPQWTEFTSQHGIVLDDDERTFHVMPESVVGLGTRRNADDIEPSIVGTLESSLDVFQPAVRTLAFESEIPWDLEIGVSLKLDPGGSRARALEPRLLPSPAQADLLTASTLGVSQALLDEARQIGDALIRPIETKYRFVLFCHPFVCELIAALRRGGVAGLLDPDPAGPDRDLACQQISRSGILTGPYAVSTDVLGSDLIDEIDFAPGGAYGKYNWEIFFHAPLLIATRLARNQRFEEARRWFHFVFDPTHRSNETDPLRFWQIKPFHRAPDAPIEAFLATAASDDGSPATLAARAAYDAQIEAWLDDPFSPHDIAELRTTAYQKTLVMKYLDNLIAWGDQLFRRDTIESINEATQLYVTALQLLGERPDALPSRDPVAALTFEQVRASLDESVLANPLVRLENLLPLPVKDAPLSSPLTMAASSWTGLLFPQPKPDGTGPAAPGFYFCIPPNEQLLAYWDTVEDRLFKIRHCMNIEGVVRQLPLFEPPIDPAMLVRARAGGIDLASALADLNAPLPHYRFQVVLQKAYALNQSVRGLGAALLAALEKADAEALSLLRASHEVAVLEAVREVRKLAVEDARHALAAAQQSLAVVELRRDYYGRLVAAGLRPEEVLQAAQMQSARKKQQSGSRMLGLGAALSSIPAIHTGASGIAGTPLAYSTVVTGLAVAKGLEMVGQSVVIDAASLNSTAAEAGVTAGLIRRGEEWVNQRDLAVREIKQIEKQIKAAEVRLALAERERENHERQVGNARSVREFMETKFTSADLWQWMAGQLSSLYFQSYQLAYDLAKQAERAFQHELALPQTAFIQFGYWDSLKKGLLAGERLQHDLERMDKAYLDQNRREYELTRHVSLALLDPVALVELQTTGRCEFSLPEAMYDLDHPGHYLRRLKSVSVTVPCVTGPYTSVPMRLTLISSRTRIDPGGDAPYPEDPAAADGRFQYDTGAVQSIAISTGREDGGVFAPDHRDERYLPFEGRGAIGAWSLRLTSAVPTFDWTSISDVVLHVRYTAREGGEPLRAAALTSLGDQFNTLPLAVVCSARSEFATAWNAFLRPPEGNTEAVLDIDLSETRLPWFTRDASPRITALQVVFLRAASETDWPATGMTVSSDGGRVEAAMLVSSAALFGGEPSATVGFGSNGIPPGTLRIAVPAGAMGSPELWAQDAWLVATYQVAFPSSA